MLSIGWSELLIVAAIALIVVGPRDLPVMLRHLGRAAGAVRRMGNEFRAEIDKAGATDDLRQLRRSIADPLRAATSGVSREFNKPVTSAKAEASSPPAQTDTAVPAERGQADAAGEAGTKPKPKPKATRKRATKSKAAQPPAGKAKAGATRRRAGRKTERAARPAARKPAE